MRRFRLLDSAGTVRGEGVQWSDNLVTYRIDNGERRTIDVAELKMVNAEGLPDAIQGKRVEWIDSERFEASSSFSPDGKVLTTRVRSIASLSPGYRFKLE